MNPSRLVACLLAALCLIASARTACAAETNSSSASVTVQFPLRSEREHIVPWRRGLTVDGAIASAAGSDFPWKQAWRWRSTFWTRHSLDPQSLPARIFGGSGASGYRRFTKSEGRDRKAVLRPGDRIFVDLEPIS